MELILVILKMGIPWPHLPSREVHTEQITASRAARYLHGDMLVQMLLSLFEQLLRLYLACTYISV